jgi:hypothetical protein
MIAGSDRAFAVGADIADFRQQQTHRRSHPRLLPWRRAGLGARLPRANRGSRRGVRPSRRRHRNNDRLGRNAAPAALDRPQQRPRHADYRAKARCARSPRLRPHRCNCSTCRSICRECPPATTTPALASCACSPRGSRAARCCGARCCRAARCCMRHRNRAQAPM